MSQLIPVKYGKKEYPGGITPSIEELACHFDVCSLNPSMDYSLHTEYSYGPRKFSSDLVNKYSTLVDSSKKGVPELWKGREWAIEFSTFLEELVGENNPPAIIEIHPPFSNYIKSLEEFIEIYSIFELRINQIFPDTKIFIENRSGTIYSQGSFLISKDMDMVNLSELIRERKLSLRMVLDIPQLLTAHSINNKTEDKLKEAVANLKKCAGNIEGIHLWGKKTGKNGRMVSHAGDLNTYFFNSTSFKKIFLKNIYELFNDNKKRYFVPEVNSSTNDLESIVTDLINSGFKFV